MDDALEDRVDALERAVTDGDGDLSALAEAGEVTARLDAIETQIAEIERRVDELDGATQALRGYVGNIRSVNCDVEDRADAALSKVESLEERLNDRDPDERDRRETDCSRNRSAETRDASTDRDDSSDERLQPNSGRREQASIHLASNGARDTHERRCGECGRPRTNSERVHAGATSTGANSTDTGNTGGHDPFGATSESDDPLQPEPSATNGGSGPLERIRQLL
ncbi:DUF7310 family coiled-coil domain-containing protein [Halovenus marina]|uniref:DUF7310 family coiled-coil domain-containing protein n=1 Tax=Halovenus marina TaxID=3396621 RepID=UPI003F563403